MGLRAHIGPLLLAVGMVGSSGNSVLLVIAEPVNSLDSKHSYSWSMNYNFQQPPAPVLRAPKNGMGTSALVIGVAACTAVVSTSGAEHGAGSGFVLGVLGIIFGCIGISRANAHIATNKASAIAGLVTALAGTLLSVISLGAAA